MPADSPTQEELSAYQAAAAKADRDVLAHIRLASWCEIHGMQVERHKHLGSRLSSRPDHPAVHGLLGQVADKGEWRMPQAVADDYLNDPEAKATLALYRGRRDKCPDTAQAHWQLAEWCEENGLKAEAKAHFAAVVRLNPAREEAWKKLGYLQAQRPVDDRRALRSPSMTRSSGSARPTPAGGRCSEKWSGWLSRKSKRDEAEAALCEAATTREPCLRSGKSSCWAGPRITSGRFVSCVKSTPPRPRAPWPRWP